MIYLNYQNDKKLQHWYAGQIRAFWAKPSKKPGLLRPDLQGLWDSLFAITPKNLDDILLRERPALEKTYAWIKEYGKLCDFVAYYPLLEEQAKKSRFYWEYPKLRQNYLGQHMGFYLETLIDGLSSSPDELIRSWANFSQLKKAAAQCLLDANLLVREFFDYSMMSQETRHELFRKMDVPVCPYCNRQYIHTVSLAGKKPYLGDLDHFYPQSYYPLFSLSLWNLIPVCKPCNQLFKRQYNRKLLSPQEAGFDDDCILEITAHEAAALLGYKDSFTLHWKISPLAPAEKADKIRQNLQLFHLDDVYQYHKPHIQRILQKRYLHSGSYSKKLSRMLDKIPLSEEEKNRLVYGTSLDKNQFHKELLGKMTYDIVMQ